MKNIFFLVVICSLCGCIPGLEEDSSGNTAEWSGPVNKAGFPEVAGRYSFFQTDQVQECSDGGVENIPDSASNISVSQDGNKLIAESEIDLAEDGVFTINEDSKEESGLVGKTGKFSYSTSVKANISGRPEEIILTSSINGVFKADSWEGTTRFVFAVPSDFFSCTTDGKFSGDKLN